MYVCVHEHFLTRPNLMNRSMFPTSRFEKKAHEELEKKKGFNIFA